MAFALLRDRELPEVIDGLCTLPGVGPKVVACIALVSLDKNLVIPVDTHVWKLTRTGALRRLRSHQWRIYWLKMFMSFLQGGWCPDAVHREQFISSDTQLHN